MSNNVNRAPTIEGTGGVDEWIEVAQEADGDLREIAGRLGTRPRKIKDCMQEWVAFREAIVDEWVNIAQECDGNISEIARRLSTRPYLVYNFMERSPRFEEAIEEARRGVYAEAQQNLIDGMRGKDNVDIDQQWATERVLETYGDTVDDGLNFTPKRTTEVTGGAGLIIRPPQQESRQITDSSQEQIDEGEVEVLPEETEN